MGQIKYYAKDKSCPDDVYIINSLYGSLIKIPKKSSHLENYKCQDYDDAAEKKRRFLKSNNKLPDYFPGFFNELIVRCVPFGIILGLVRLLTSPFLIFNKNFTEITPASLLKYCRFSSSSGHCLNKSIFYFLYLRLHGLRPVIVIGLFTPTNQMHAWIEVGDFVLFENRDFINHFQPILRSW